MRVPPWPVVAVVMSHDAANDAMVVAFPSLQMPGTSVRRLYDGSADSLRISKKPLPTRGTHGLVIFPMGDLRNPVWLGAIQQNLSDAIPSDANDPFMHYDSHFSGHWSLLDQFGNHATQFADGTSLTVNASGGALPTTYRNIVDQNQERQRVAFPFSQRVPSPPQPFTLSISQATSGSLGGATVTIDASGNVNITPSAGGNVVITGNLHVTQNVIAGYGGGDSVTLQNHLHSGVTTGSSNTQKPNAGT